MSSLSLSGVSQLEFLPTGVILCMLRTSGNNLLLHNAFHARSHQSILQAMGWTTQGTLPYSVRILLQSHVDCVSGTIWHSCHPCSCRAFYHIAFSKAVRAQGRASWRAPFLWCASENYEEDSSNSAFWASISLHCILVWCMVLRNTSVWVRT